MQNDLDVNFPSSKFDILGVNEFGHESGNAAMTDGRDLPWLQEQEAGEVWQAWGVNYRDVVILDTGGEVYDVFNLTDNDLANVEHYGALKTLLEEAAQ